ncbi:MAG: signal peptidase II [Bryobacteraceae bacterium]
MSQRTQSAIIIALVTILDRLTKMWIVSSVDSITVIPVIPGIFNIVHAENPGAAFSMLADAPEAWRKIVLVGISMVVMGFVLALLWRPLESRLMRISLPMVFGGALGNLIDRIFRGTVTDFIQVFLGPYEYPSFNIADSAIFIGACLLVLDLIRSGKSEQAASS